MVGDRKRNFTLIKEYPFQEVFDRNIDDIVKDMEDLKEKYYKQRIR